MSIYKRLISGVLLLSLAAGITGCRAHEAAFVGAVLGAAVGVAMTQQQYRQLPPPPRYYRYCSQYVQQGYIVEHTPWGPRIIGQYGSYQTHCMSTDALKPTVVSNQQFAEVLETDVETASSVLSTLKQIADGQASSVESFGLSQDDLMTLSRFELPSAAGLENLSKALGHDSVETTRRVLQRLLDEAAAQQRARDENNRA